MIQLRNNLFTMLNLVTSAEARLHTHDFDDDVVLEILDILNYLIHECKDVVSEYEKEIIK